MGGPVELVILAFAALVALVVAEAAIRRTDIGATLVLGLVLLQEATPHIALATFVGPFRVSAGDLLFVILMTAAVARILRQPRLTPAQRLLLLFAVLVAWSIFRGVEPYGLATAINEARKYLGFVAAALYFSTVEADRKILDRVGGLLLGTALGLAFITLVRWVANTAGLTGGFFGDGADLRVVPAASALLIAQGFFISVSFLGDRTRGFLLRYAAPILLVLVVLLQHRTVWVVTALGLAYLAVRDRNLSKRLLGVFTVGIILLAVLLSVVFQEREGEVSDQLSTSAQSTGTFEWRIEGWAALFRDSGPDGLTEWAVGPPFGTGWDRVSANTGRIIEVSPHNFYVESVLRVGLVGLIALLLLYGIAIRGTLFRRELGSRDGLMTPQILGLIVGLQLIYFIPYSADPAQAMLLGLGCAMATDQLPRNRASSARIGLER